MRGALLAALMGGGGRCFRFPLRKATLRKSCCGRVRPPANGNVTGPEVLGDKGGAYGAVWNISTPRMRVYRPAKPNGAEVLVAGGGGYLPDPAVEGEHACCRMVAGARLHGVRN